MKMISRKFSHTFLLYVFISVAVAARRSRIDILPPVASLSTTAGQKTNAGDALTNDNIASASSSELIQVPVQTPSSPSPPTPSAPFAAQDNNALLSSGTFPVEPLAANGATNDQSSSSSSSSSSSASAAAAALSASSSLVAEAKSEENTATLFQEQNQSSLPSVDKANAAEKATFPVDQLRKDQQQSQENQAFSSVEDNKTANTNNGQGVEECDPDMIGFEIITGYVFSAPDKLLESLPGTLMITDCLEACQSNETCHAVNYETGLCVLFSANADKLSGALTKSQFPVFTIYAQKSCLGVRPCARAWCVDRVQGYKLTNHAKRSVNVTSRRDCIELCLGETEFTCRSANFYRKTNVCELSEMDRITLAGANAFQPEEGIDYLENNCAEEPNKLCEFKRLSGRILKTVDSVYQDVGSIDECRDLCLNSPYRCHSYDYGDTGEMVCRLSHHNRATLSDIQDPYLSVADAATYELYSCYNVTIECGAGDMIARIRTSKLFDGKVYAKGSPKSCAYDVKSSLDFELRMGYQDLECNVRQSGSGRYMNDVVIQHHDTIVTSSDLGLAVTCQYDLTNKSVSNEVDLGVTGDIGPALSEEVIVDSPNVMMKITSRDGGDVMRSAEVGDPLALKFEIMDAQSPYDIFVRELVAMDGGDNAEITLIDANGCPTDHFIMGPIYKSTITGKVLLSHFDAFKFPSSEVVQFRALVTPCMPSCEPVQCDQEEVSGEVRSLMSFGRRRRSVGNATSLFKRRSRRDTTNKPSQEDMLLVQSIQITDKFGFDKQQQTKSTGFDSNETVFISGDASQGFCVNAIGLIVAGTIFLLAQLAVISIWTYLYQRRKKQNLYAANEGHSNSSIYGGLSGSSGSTMVTTVPNAMNSNRSESLCKLYDSGFSGRHGRQF